MDPDGMVALLNYREDGVTRKSPLQLIHSALNSLMCGSAYFTFWKHGLKETKL